MITAQCHDVAAEEIIQAMHPQYTCHSLPYTAHVERSFSQMKLIKLDKELG